MLDAVRRFLAAHAIEPCHLLIACSGGVDSTALLLVASDLRADGFTISAGHVNHHLRGDESDGDETFVRDLCARLVVPLHVVDGTIDDDAIRDHGLEGAARDVRYAGLGAIRDKIGARYVATAHQKNDQAETVLMRMVSGTGLAGLRGIHAIRDDG
ncbi:MAG TPA: tRNA lysidine(34) synthetase TilS, partial [Thermoanaerobaculia bacterium]